MRSSSSSTKVGKGDHPTRVKRAEDGGRGVARDDALATTAKLEVRRPLHRPSGGPPPPEDEGRQCRLKYCTARSCFSAAARLSKVPRLRRRPVFGFFLRE